MLVPDLTTPAATFGLHGPSHKEAAIGRALKWGLIAVLACAPLPLASARPLAWSLLALASGLLIVLAVACEVTDRTSVSALHALRIPLALVAALTFWIGVQSLPLDIAGSHSQIWEGAAQALGHPVAPSISLDREISLGRLLRLLTYASIFLVAWRVACRSEGAAALLRAIAAIGVSYSLYGLIVYFSGNQTILWFPKWAYKLDLTSTFVNRNSFATFVGLSLIASLALMAQVLIKYVDGRSMRTLAQSSIECVLWRGRWLTIGLVICGSALLFTHSRGGTMATLIGAAALMVSASAAPSLRTPWRLPFVMLAASMVIAVFAISGAGVLTRVAATASEADLRFDIDSGIWQAIADHFVAGTGLGTFQFVYAAYQPQSVGLFVDLAHNDYLENALELGVPAAAVFYALLLLLVWRCLRGMVERRRDAIFACGALGASALVGSHAAVDFSMQMPAVAITYAALLGVGVAQSVSSRGRTEPPAARSSA